MQQVHPKSQLAENMLDLIKAQQKANVLMVQDSDFLKKGGNIKMQQGCSSEFGSQTHF